jgi:RNA polymerase sigma factor (sigma-70 family)
MTASSPTLPADRAAQTRHVNVAQAVDHLFRRESGRLVAILAGRLGAAHLHLAEDVVQDALLRAMQVWPFTGVPANPSAWLLQTARNRAFDLLRRHRAFERRTPALVPLVEECARDAMAVPAPQFEDEIADRQLRMMFVCCAPGLPLEAQVSMILKTLCGFNEAEIAAAFLTREAAVAKRLVRSRQFLRNARVRVELPPARQLAPRVESIRHALYLLFNEGYKASHGDSLLRRDLCAEAIRLTTLLAAHPLGDRAETHALLALQHLHAARLDARVADDGSLLVLADQDRSRWDRAQINRGLAHLERSGEGSRITRWHLEAGIAACHALAPNHADTQWTHIVHLYDELLRLDASPIVALNRAVALARVHGPAAGLAALAALRGRRTLEGYHLFHAVKGQLLFDAGQRTEAAAALRQALALVRQPAERELLNRRLAEATRI